MRLFQTLVPWRMFWVLSWVWVSRRVQVEQKPLYQFRCLSELLLCLTVANNLLNEGHLWAAFCRTLAVAVACLAAVQAVGRTCSDFIRLCQVAQILQHCFPTKTRKVHWSCLLILNIFDIWETHEYFSRTSVGYSENLKFLILLKDSHIVIVHCALQCASALIECKDCQINIRLKNKFISSLREAIL